MTLVLDSGALIALERNDRDVTVLLRRAIELGASVVVPAGVVAQVWRDPGRQVRLTRLLNAEAVEVADLDFALACAVGRLLAARQASDVIDGSVVVLAAHHYATVVTSDVVDIRRLDPEAHVIGC